jgi:hypothetical protein
MGKPFGGRPRGARNRLTVRVFEDVLQHWNEPSDGKDGLSHGRAALEILFKEKPGEYVRAVLSILPKEFTIESVTADLKDDELDGLMARIREQLEAARKPDIAEDEPSTPNLH